MRWVLLAILSVSLVACVSTHKKLPDAPVTKNRTKARKKDKPPQQRDGALTRVQVLQTARSLVGSSQVVIGEQRFRSDCSGFVCAVYEAHGVKLPHSSQPTPRVSSSQSMYLAAAENLRMYTKGVPRPGDLVFFRDTYDANRDGRINDDVTHVGLVESVEPGGTVVVLHFASGRVKRGRLNLTSPDRHKSPDGRVLNDFLRRKRADDPKKARYLAGELFVSYAAVVP